MPLSPEQQEYLDKRPHMERLTFTGVNDLYKHFVYGARTIADCMRMDIVAANYHKGLQEKVVRGNGIFDDRCSEKLSIRNERCIDKNGMSEAAW